MSKFDVHKMLDENEDTVSNFEIIVPHIKRKAMKELEASNETIEELYVLIIRLYTIDYLDFEGNVNYTGKLRTDFFLEQYRKTAQQVGTFGYSSENNANGYTEQTIIFIRKFYENIQTNYIPVKFLYKFNKNNAKLITMRTIEQFFAIFREITFDSNYYELDYSQLVSYEEFLAINGIYTFESGSTVAVEVLHKQGNRRNAIRNAIQAYQLSEKMLDEYSTEETYVLMNEDQFDTLSLHQTVLALKMTELDYLAKDTPFISYFGDSVLLDGVKDFIQSTIRFVAGGGDIKKAFETLKQYLSYINILEYRAIGNDDQEAAVFTYSYTEYDKLIEIAITENLFGENAYRYSPIFFGKCNGCENGQSEGQEKITANGTDINVERVLQRLKELAVTL